jgi:PhzF family phenazine biosynthesis protein
MYTLFQIDAFADKIFTGNPAAVIPLEKWVSDQLMQNIAMENNLSETAFFIQENNEFYIRWFTPISEVNLCGHATLASGHVIFNHTNYNNDQIIFNSKSGILKIRKEGQFIILDFPASDLEEISIPANIEQALGIRPEKCIRGREDMMFIFDNAKEIKSLSPDLRFLKTLNARGIIVTAPSDEYDFVSRFFAPVEGIDEDPVTGSAHTMLIPYWSGLLQKRELTAKQISSRGGVLKCTNKGSRVEIGGKAVTYMIGEICIH